MMAESNSILEAKEFLSQFCTNASAHGFYHLHSNKSVSKKIIWLLLLGTIFVATSFHIYSLVSCYLRYNYYTAVTSDADLPLKVKNCSRK